MGFTVTTLNFLWCNRCINIILQKLYCATFIYVWMLMPQKKQGTNGHCTAVNEVRKCKWGIFSLSQGQR